MKLSFNCINNNTNSVFKSRSAALSQNRASFGGIQNISFAQQKDSFVNNEKNGLKKITVNHIDYSTKESRLITVYQNPSDKAVLYKKVFNPKTKKYDKVPYEVDVASCNTDLLTTYVLLDPKSKRELGYCEIADVNKLPEDGIIGDFMLKDYPKYGITGSRVTILGLKNNFHNSLSGVGEVCDRIALEHCLKNHIEPNIISYADCDSHAAHYKRGRRFFDVRETPFLLDPDKFYQNYKTYDPNVVIERLIQQSPEGQHVYTGNLFGNFYVYASRCCSKVLEGY